MTITRILDRRASAFTTHCVVPWLLVFTLIFQGTMATAHAHGLTAHGNAVSAVPSAAKPAKGGKPAVPLDDGCTCPICHVLQSGGLFVAAASPALLLPALVAEPIAAQIETRLAGFQSHSVQPRAPPLPH